VLAVASRRPRARRLPGLAVPLLLVALALAAPAPARAHAIVLESSPAHDAVVDRAPDAVLIRFNGKIVHRLSRASIEPAPGQTAPASAARARPISVDLTGEEARPGPDRLRVRLPALSPGIWVLRYRVLAADGHVTAGALRFTVREAQ
jgi:methionine-rich copper-binding protein CopC